jgi:hypothetical protein
MNASRSRRRRIEFIPKARLFIASISKFRKFRRRLL